jgi:hypothetical protein
MHVIDALRVSYHVLDIVVALAYIFRAKQVLLKEKLST